MTAGPFYAERVVRSDNLRKAFYDEREMGNIPSDTTALLLPNGVVLRIEE